MANLFPFLLSPEKRTAEAHALRALLAQLDAQLALPVQSPSPVPTGPLVAINERFQLALGVPGERAFLLARYFYPGRQIGWAGRVAPPLEAGQKREAEAINRTLTLTYGPELLPRAVLEASRADTEKRLKALV